MIDDVFVTLCRPVYVCDDWQDRKVILKSMKSLVVKIATEEFGHLVLLAAFDVVDDTKFVQKVILDVRTPFHCVLTL